MVGPLLRHTSLSWLLGGLPIGGGTTWAEGWPTVTLSIPQQATPTASGVAAPFVVHESFLPPGLGGLLIVVTARFSVTC